MATDVRSKEQLPQGVGRFSAGWKVFIALAFVVFAFGVFAYTRELSNGMVETGMRDVGTMGGATWGIYIAMVVYFIGVSFAGITVAALIRILRLEKLRSIARMAELLTVVSLILGALAIIVDLGQPVRGVINLFRYARPQSPFFGTFSLVIAGYLFASLVYLYLGGRRDAAVMAKYPGRLQWFHRWWAAGYEDTEEERERHHKSSFWMALAIVPLLIIAHSTLGFVFGLQVGRPGWYGTLQAPAFVALAGVSGIGHIVILSAIIRRVLRAEARITEAVFAWLGKILLLFLAVYVYFMSVELFTLLYATPEVEKRLSDALISGEYAWIYWGSVAVLVIPMAVLAWQALNRRWNVGLLVASGVLVNLGAIGKRYLIVVPSQTHGTLLPYEVGSYSPSWVEYGVVAGLFALGALLIGLFIKAFPVLPIDEGEEVMSRA
ncbi:MAG: polysulfide reductase NrfD [Acidimicrobiia bacterium]|nr:polysulfide reductase NrfD [Acidimicrobiia bacterium]